jgi:hypothetical protein
MSAAPLHAFTSPTAGTGKSLLVDVAAMLAINHPMSVISQGRTEEELEKRLGAALLAGDIAIALDNCEHPLQSTFLCQALRSCPSEWCNNGEAVVISGRAGSIRLPLRAA